MTDLLWVLVLFGIVFSFCFQYQFQLQSRNLLRSSCINEKGCSFLDCKGKSNQSNFAKTWEGMRMKGAWDIRNCGKGQFPPKGMILHQTTSIPSLMSPREDHICRNAKVKWKGILGYLGSYKGFEVSWKGRNVDYRSGVSIVADGRYMVAKGMKSFLWFFDFFGRGGTVPNWETVKMGKQGIE